MAKSENQLLSLLFEDGRVLENIKFFPGEKCASSEELFGAAYNAIAAVVDGKGIDVIPADGAKKLSIGELVSSL